MPRETTPRWTNLSVRRLLTEEDADDPVDAIVQRARRVVCDAFDAGWTGPPFDPIQLADLLKIDVAPSADTQDARTVPVGATRGRIEFNPSRPAGRVRYSIAHEIAHTLFRDCYERVRLRQRHHQDGDDAWQLEALCNVAAAELLMPFGSLADVAGDAPTIERVLGLQKQFQVSVEAMLIRVVRLSNARCAMFCASRAEQGLNADRYRIDYAIRSPSWHDVALPQVLPAQTAVAQCVAVGYTAVATEAWQPGSSGLRVEALGVPPYPGSRYPRVVGLVQPSDRRAAAGPGIQYLRGNATKPRGSGPKVIVQVVNDKTPNWGGGGFAQAVRAAWPPVQEDFQAWVAADRRNFHLGAVRISSATRDIQVGSVVAQHGYGQSPQPRIRYGALRNGLMTIAQQALGLGATLHMPRIGAGQAGGSWPVIEDLIRATCCDAGLSVVIYDLPGSEPPQGAPQHEFRFG